MTLFLSRAQKKKKKDNKVNRNPTVVHLWMEQLSRKNKRLKERTLQVTSVRKLASFARTNGATLDARLVLFLLSFTSFQQGEFG